MDVERYRRAQSIFDQVVDLDRVSRTAAIDVACGTDSALRQLVQELVDLDAQDSPIDDAAPALAATLARTVGGVKRLQPGDEVDRYVVEALLGSGGTARVWAVRHRTLGTRHALKVLTWSDETLRERLLREARAQARLDHPNILPVRDVLEVGEAPALLMPLIDGPPLDILLRHVTPSLEEAVWLLHGILAGVGHAHASGLIHRDIKSANVLLELRDGLVVPRVSDFGLVKATDAQTLTRPGDIMCTLASAAPEQLVDPAHVDQRADIWSVGVVAYHVATGTRPFPGNTLQAVVDAHVEGPDLDRVPAPLRPLVAAALVKDPDARAASVDALVDLLPPLPKTPPTVRLFAIAEHVRDGTPTEEALTLSPTGVDHKPDWTPPTLAPEVPSDPSSPPPDRTGRLQPLQVLLSVVALFVIAGIALFWATE